MHKRRLIFCLAILMTLFAIISCSSPEYTTAKMAVQQGDLAKAEEYFLKAMDIEPDNPEIPYKLAAEVYQKQEKYKLVKKYMDISLKRGPKFKSQIKEVYKYNWGHNFNEGVKYFNALITDEATERDAAIDKAIYHFSTALIFNPADENTVVQLARSHKNFAENPEKALEILDEGIKNVEEKSNLLGMKADMLTEMGRKDEAKTLLQEALEDNPDNLINIQRLGAMYFDDEQYDEAIGLYKAAIEQFPGEKDIYFNLAILYVRMGDYENANLQFQTVLAFDPNDLEVIEAVGDVYMNQEDYISAESYYRQLYDTDPMNPNYMRKLGNALNGQKRYEEGMNLIREAKALE